MHDWNEWQVFAAIATYGNLTAASRRLGIPKSTVSRTITRMEKHLGVRLLERTTRRVQLTEAGLACREFAQRMTEEAESGQTAATVLRSVPRGELRVGVPVTILRTFLGSTLPRFLASYPEVTLFLDVNPSTIDPAASGLDLVIRVGRLTDSNLMVRRLGGFEFGLFASPAFASRMGLPVAPSEISRYPVAAAAPESTWSFTRKGKTEEIRVKPRVAVSDPATLQQMASASVALAALPLFAARQELEGGRLIPVLSEWKLPPIELFALYPAKRGLAPKVRVFLDFLQEYLKVA